jgi:hypothetical protein
MICVCSTVAEELLIDFRELIGQHSGENLASALYDTLTLYGLQGRVSFEVIPDFCMLTPPAISLWPSTLTMHQTTTPWSST